jgi:hypothetical protein
MCSYFPQLGIEEENEDLMVEISKEELLAVMSYFQKDKSPGPDVGQLKFI